MTWRKKLRRNVGWIIAMKLMTYALFVDIAGNTIQNVPSQGDVTTPFRVKSEAILSTKSNHIKKNILKQWFVRSVGAISGLLAKAIFLRQSSARLADMRSAFIMGEGNKRRRREMAKKAKKKRILWKPLYQGAKTEIVELTAKVAKLEKTVEDQTAIIRHLQGAKK